MKSKVLAFVVSGVIASDLYGSGIDDISQNIPTQTNIKAHIHHSKDNVKHLKISFFESAANELEDLLEYLEDLGAGFLNSTSSPISTPTISNANPFLQEETSDNPISDSPITPLVDVSVTENNTQDLEENTTTIPVNGPSSNPVVVDSSATSVPDVISEPVVDASANPVVIDPTIVAPVSAVVDPSANTVAADLASNN